MMNPLTWLKIHLQFLKIKAEWDPTMDRAQFIEATKQASE